LISTTVQTNSTASIQKTKQGLVPGNEKEHARQKEKLSGFISNCNFFLNHEELYRKSSKKNKRIKEKSIKP
jgi:hypothetical protein